MWRFILSDLLNLWEHQSTFNPNMPARGLGYFSQLYQQYIEKYGVNLYSSKQKKLPFPQYIVFYNGEKDMPGADGASIVGRFLYQRQ